MERVLDSLSESQVSGVILTKFDEAVHLGDIMTSLLRHDIPLTSWADGQDIANDLHRADAAVLVSKAMHLNKTAVESKDDRILFSIMQSHRELWRIFGTSFDKCRISLIIQQDATGHNLCFARFQAGNTDTGLKGQEVAGTNSIGR